MSAITIAVQSQEITSTAREAGREVREAASNPWLERAQRLGYVVRGVLYGVVGLLAMEIAIGGGGRAVDQRGSLQFLVANPFGKVVLVVCVVGLAAYSLWGFVRAVYDPLHRGSKPGGIVARLGFAWSGAAYATLVWFALQLLLSPVNAAQGDSVQASVATMLRAPAGGALTVAAGLVAIAGATGQFVDAYRAPWRGDFERYRMSPEEQAAANMLGVLGYVARGITFGLVGWFMVQAGVHHDPAQAHSYGGAFLFLLQQPFGRWLLGFTAAGFVALGIHSLACARWMRLG